MDYLKTTQIIIRPVDTILLDIFSFIKTNYNINIYNSRVLEVGSGTGNKTIELAKLFKSYYSIESDYILYNIQTELLKEHNSNVKSFNMDFFVFAISIPKKFKLIYLENVIHLMDINLFFYYAQNILDSSGFIIIKTPIPKPFGWGNNEFNKSSEQFNISKWKKFKNKLLDNYHILDTSPNLINKITNEFFIYFVFLF
jgi:SAM-dependent methyltransferase